MTEKAIVANDMIKKVRSKIACKHFVCFFIGIAKPLQQHPKLKQHIVGLLKLNCWFYNPIANINNIISHGKEYGSKVK